MTIGTSDFGCNSLQGKEIGVKPLLVTLRLKDESERLTAFEAEPQGWVECCLAAE